MTFLLMSFKYYATLIRSENVLLGPYPLGISDVATGDFLYLIKLSNKML